MITHEFYKPLELYFVFKDQKLFCQKRMVSKRFLYLAFGPLSVDQPVDRRQSKIALSADRAVD